MPYLYPAKDGQREAVCELLKSSVDLGPTCPWVLTLPGPFWAFERRLSAERFPMRFIGVEKDDEVYGKALRNMPGRGQELQLLVRGPKHIPLVRTDVAVLYQAKLTQVVPFLQPVDAAWLDLCSSMSPRTMSVISSVARNVAQRRDRVVPIAVSFLAGRNQGYYQNILRNMPDRERAEWVGQMCARKAGGRWIPAEPYVHINPRKSKFITARGWLEV